MQKEGSNSGRIFGMILFWILVFCISLAALVKGADWLIASAEKIGLSWGCHRLLWG
jgi:Ca2+/Na+ antiporter